MAGWWWRWWWMSRIVDQDEFAEVKLVGEPFPFGLVQDAFVVVVSGSRMFPVSDLHSLTASVCSWQAVTSVRTHVPAGALRIEVLPECHVLHQWAFSHLNFLFDSICWRGVHFIYSSRLREKLWEQGGLHTNHLWSCVCVWVCVWANKPTLAFCITWAPGWACRNSCVVCPSSPPTAWPASRGPWWQTRPTPLPSRWRRPRLDPAAPGGSATAGPVWSRATRPVCRPSQGTALLERHEEVL